MYVKCLFIFYKFVAKTNLWKVQKIVQKTPKMMSVRNDNCTTGITISEPISNDIGSISFLLLIQYRYRSVSLLLVLSFKILQLGFSYQPYLTILYLGLSYLHFGKICLVIFYFKLIVTKSSLLRQIYGNLKK